MRALDLQVVEQRRCIRRMISDRDGRRRARAADPASLVVRDQLIAIRQRSFASQRPKAVGEDRADQQHWFAGAGDLVFQLDAVYGCALHGPASCAVFVAGRQRLPSCAGIRHVRLRPVSERFDLKA
jgi:hypothetical protein